MKHSFRSSFLIILTLLALAFSALGATPAFADDSVPPATEEVSQPPVDEPVGEEEPVLEESEEQEVVPTEEPSEPEPAESEEPASAPEEEAPTAAEILEQLPAEIDLVVLDKSGTALPLVAEDTAEVLAAPDPYFTVAGTLYQFTAHDCDPGTPGDQPCATPIQAAINYLANLDATPDDGTIYVELGTYNESISIEYWRWSSWSNLGNLALVGAGSNSTTINGYLSVHTLNNFTLDGFLFNGAVYVNADGDVKIQDTVVQNVIDLGLLIKSDDGNVMLDDVTVQMNTDGAIVTTKGDITINNSTFSENDAYGLQVESNSGSITLNGVNASRNGGSDRFTLGEYGVFAVAEGDINVTNSRFDNNYSYGLDAYSYSGDITLNGVNASGNDENGASAFSFNGDVLVKNSSFSNNEWLGLRAGLPFGMFGSPGNITLDNVSANGNGEVGAYAFTLDGNILVFNSTFNDNEFFGLEALSIGGSVKLDQVTAGGNPWLGAYLISDKVVDIFCSNFSSSDLGLYAETPNMNLNGVSFSGNDVDYLNGSGEVTVSEYPCGNGNSDGKGKKQVVLYLIIPQTADLLPNGLAEGDTFASALKVILTEKGATVEDLSITLVFPIPEEMKETELGVVYWDGLTWQDIPGGYVIGDYFVVTVDHPGFFVLVSR